MTQPAGATGSTLTHLEGGLSGTSYPADELVTTDPLDGRPLLARYDLERAATALNDRRRDARVSMRGLWRWHGVLPVRDWSNVVTLGEGSTPLLEAPRLGPAYGIGRLLVKAESLNPTGSFKARGMSVAVSRAKELGATSFVMPSAGNAGGALAAYAAVAGSQATVVMPSDSPIVNHAEVVACGADLILVDGLISDCGRLTARIAERIGAFNLSTLKEPYRVEGKKTMGIELAEDLGWSLPDVIVYPMGGGTGLIGMWKAFAELESMGLIGDARPRMVGVQVEGCAPLVRAFLAGQRFADPWADATTDAAGLRVPSTVGDFLILDAINASGGTAIAVPEAELASTQRFAARHGAGFLSLESAAAFAALAELRSCGAIEPGDTVVAFDTGAGFKSTLPEVPPRRSVSADGSDWESLLSGYASV
ncbi:MAG TPA: threonine synthase [Candidatus Acidoferrales bacterium]|nr:threonine synthase [Candidatus Acidoferrales bacterium]